MQALHDAAVQAGPPSSTTERSIERRVGKALADDDLRAVDGISSKHRAYLVRSGFSSTAEVLFTPLQALGDHIKLPTSECADIVAAIVRHRASLHTSKHAVDIVAQLAPKCFHSQSVAEQLGLKQAQPTPMASRISRLSTGDEGLDRVLGGGVVSGALTEFAGEASSGKTAICLQLSARCQLPLEQGGFAGCCAYLSSEGNFPSLRLVEIANATIPLDVTDVNARRAAVRSFTDNVHLIHCSEIETLLHAVRYSLPALIERQSDAAQSSHSSTLPVRLVMVDSIAAPFRGQDAESASTAPVSIATSSAHTSKIGNDTTSNGNAGRNMFAERSRDLTEIANCLYRLAQKHDLAVVIVNQVSDVFTSRRYEYQKASLDDNEADELSDDGDHTNLPIEYRRYGYASKFFSGEMAGASRRARAEARKMAVFGLAWTNCINTRIMLSRTGRRVRRADGLEVSDEELAQLEISEDAAEVGPMAKADINVTLRGGTEELRRADVVFGPFSEKGRIDYVFRKSGLVSVGRYIEEPRLPFGIKAKHMTSRRKSLSEADNDSQGGDTEYGESQLCVPRVTDDGNRIEKQAFEAQRVTTNPNQSSSMLDVQDDDEAALWEEFNDDDPILEELDLRDAHGLTQVVPETQTW